MQKRVQFQALGATASEALHYALQTPEFEGFTIRGATIQVIERPDAVKTTLDFIEASATTIPGFDSTSRQRDDLQLWAVDVTLEFVFEEPARPQGNTIPDPARPAE
jgi:hypothetical protein